jgi:hypothetical protein
MATKAVAVAVASVAGHSTSGNVREEPQAGSQGDSICYLLCWMGSATSWKEGVLRGNRNGPRFWRSIRKAINGACNGAELQRQLTIDNTTIKQMGLLCFR